jgi:branched-subunit amino acid ABC-type transport system permease component
MLGAYAMLLALAVLDLGYLPAVAFGILAAVAAGLAVERCAVRPVKSEWGVAIATIGAGLFIQYAVRRVTLGRPEAFPVPFEPVVLALGGGARVSAIQLALMAAGLALMAALLLLVYRTRLGFAIRAVAQSPPVAATLGIDLRAVAVKTFAIASGVAGAVGILHATYYQSVWVFGGIALGLKGMVVIVVAGVGNIAGCVAIGVLLGVLEVMSVGYLRSELRDFVAYTALLLILILRPGGVFGEHAKVEFKV